MHDDQALVTRDERERLPSQDIQNAGPLAAILSNPEQLQQIPIETVERLFALHRQDVADKRREAFHEALHRIQGQLEPVKKYGRNTQTGSMYARVEHVERMLMPILDREGVTLSCSTVEPVVPGTMRVCLTVRYRGHEDHAYMDAPVDDKGPKGQPVKTALHGTASTLTYCYRHLICRYFGIQVHSDDDGNMGTRTTQKVSKEQAANLEALISEVGADLPSFLSWAQVGRVSDLPAHIYSEAVRLLERKR